MKSDPDWAKWLTAQRAEMDDWMAKRNDHPLWTAGWHHDFVSPKDGSQLIFTADEPGLETLHSLSDPHVTLTPKLRGGWVYEFRFRMADEIVAAARLYRLTGDTKYAEWAAGQLDFYADHFADWPVAPRIAGDPNSKPNPGIRLQWQSLDEAVDLTKYVTAAQTLGDWVTPARKTKWATQFFLPDATLLNGSMRDIHNIATWHRAAAGFVAVYTGDVALWKTAVEDRYGVRDQLARGVTSDYLWREQSLGYNTYVARALTPFFVYATENGYGPRLTGEMETVENLLIAPIYLRFPTGQLPNPADGGGPGNISDDATTLADFGGIYPTTIGLAAGTTRRDWDTLLAAPRPSSASPTVAPALPPVKSQNLLSTREAVLKRGPWQVYVHYGQLTSSHAEAEALNYEAFYDTTDVTHDPGTSRYGSPLHSQFFSTGLAHNVPLVDGVGENGFHLGELLAFNGDTGKFSAIQPDYWKVGGAQRDISLSENGQFTDTVTVKTTDGNSHELSLLLQIQGAVMLPAAFQPDPIQIIPGPTRPAGFRYWTDVASADYTDTADFDLHYPDGRTLHLTLHAPGKFTVTHATTLDSPPKKREVLFLHLTGTDAVFQTVMEAK